MPKILGSGPQKSNYGQHGLNVYAEYDRTYAYAQNIPLNCSMDDGRGWGSGEITLKFDSFRMIEN